MKTPTAAAGLAVGLVLAAVLALAPAPARADLPPVPGKKAPAFTLPLVANGTGRVALSDLAGHPVYINFLASWCTPCSVELPYIGKLSREYAKRGVVVVGIDELENESVVKAFVRHLGLPFRVAIDRNGDVGGAYGVAGLPVHVFVDGRGRTVFVHPGEMTEAAIRVQLDSLVSHR